MSTPDCQLFYQIFPFFAWNGVPLIDYRVANGRLLLVMTKRGVVAWLWRGNPTPPPVIASRKAWQSQTDSFPRFSTKTSERRIGRMIASETKRSAAILTRNNFCKKRRELSRPLPRKGRVIFFSAGNFHPSLHKIHKSLYKPLDFRLFHGERQRYLFPVIGKKHGAGMR